MLFYADENFPLDVVKELQNLGHDVLTALEDGRANQSIPDSEVLSRAIGLGRMLLTINRKDFKRLHYQQPTHAGIVICTQDTDFVGQANRIIDAVTKTDNPTAQLIRVYRPAKIEEE